MNLAIHQMNMHTHKQAVGDILLDGQSLLGVVLAPFPLIPEGASAEHWLCKPGVPRLIGSLITPGFILKGLSLSGGITVPRVSSVCTIIRGGKLLSKDSGCHLKEEREPKYVGERVVHIKEIQGKRKKETNTRK